MTKIVVVLATWFGCGRSPKAPGTVGTLGALPLAWAVSLFAPMAQLVFIFTFTIFSIGVAHFYELEKGEHDSSEVVIDEVAGFLVTMAWVPFTWSYVLLGFLVFRLLDIWKPFPISYVDRKVGGGVGAVGDDLLAGILGSVLMQLIFQQRILA
jgi:phosphatidylglycerophosphatase A